jgi:uncharacterized protein YidB (DUF937 family)
MGLFDELKGLAGSLGGGAGEEGQGAQSLVGSLLQQGGGGPSTNIVGSLLGGLGGSGGMAGMLETLAANGLGDHVASWMSNNPNLPVSTEQIHNALGSEQVQQMAASSGLPIGDFLNQLAAHLPQAATEQSGADPA